MLRISRLIRRFNIQWVIDVQSAPPDRFYVYNYVIIKIAAVIL